VESKSDIYMADPIKRAKKEEQGIVRTYSIRYIENNAFEGPFGRQKRFEKDSRSTSGSQLAKSVLGGLVRGHTVVHKYSGPSWLRETPFNADGDVVGGREHTSDVLGTNV
jgi:hypothetical protein